MSDEKIIKNMDDLIDPLKEENLDKDKTVSDKTIGKTLSGGSDSYSKYDDDYFDDLFDGSGYATRHQDYDDHTDGLVGKGYKKFRSIFNKKTEKKSGSVWDWYDKFSSYSFYSTEASVKRQALAQLQTSCNILHPETFMKVDFLEKTVDNDNRNEANRKKLLIDDSGLIEKKEGKSAYGYKTTEVTLNKDAIDKLTGQVYLHKTINCNLFEKDIKDIKILKLQNSIEEAKKPKPNFKNCYNKSSVVENFWKILETKIAESYIGENWPGFMGSVQKNTSGTEKNKKEILSGLALKPQNVNAFINSYAWNIFNNENQINFDQEHHKKASEFLDEFLANLDIDKPRVEGINEAMNELEKFFDEEESYDDMEQPQYISGFTGGNTMDAPGTEPGTNKMDGESAGKEIVRQVFSDKLEKYAAEHMSGMDMEDTQRKNKIDIKYKTKDHIHNVNYQKDNIIKSKASGANKKEYNNIVRKNKRAITIIKNNFSFLNNCFGDNERGLRSGDIDEGNLIKIAMKDEYLFEQRNILNKKKVAVTLLVDQSGSMGSHKMSTARDSAIILYEALKDYFDFSVFGHTGNTHQSERVELYEYVSKRHKDHFSMSQMEACQQNLDGFACQLTANIMLAQSPDQRKIMFVISDGQPHGNGYAGDPAEQHLKEVCEEIRKKKIEVYGIGIYGEPEQETGERFYGKSNYIQLGTDILKSTQIINRFLKNISLKNKDVYY